MKHTLLIMVLTALLTLCLISSAGAAINWDTLPTAPEMPATFNDAMAAYPGYSAYASDSTKELILSEGNETYIHDVSLTYDLLGNPVSINVVEYEKTALGNQTRNVLFDVDGTVLSVVTSEYLSAPDFHSSKIVDAEGRRLSTGVAFREGDQFVEYTMDQNGTLQRTVYDGEDIITQSAASLQDVPQNLQIYFNEALAEYESNNQASGQNTGTDNTGTLDESWFKLYYGDFMLNHHEESNEAEDPILPGEWMSNDQGSWFVYPDGTYPVNGWVQIGGRWYYFDAEGYAVKDQWIEDYYLTSDGSMAVSCWIGGCWVDETGRWDPDHAPATGIRYQLQDGSFATNAWIQLNGKWRYFDENGFMVFNTVIDGYRIGADGTWIE